MIVLGILSVFEALLGLILGVLPTTPVLGLNTKMIAITGSGAFSYVAWANNYLPVDDALSAMGVVLGVLAITWLLRLLLWALAKLHVTGGDDG